ncbi:MAG: DUF3368 domain-containing protein [Bacteroidia bacterium]|nr:DUF3368 domain-containing protein [Bacteroidia bacterium]
MVADASPVIFLAKLGRLDLIQAGRTVEIHLSALVQDEVLVPGGAEEERLALENFLAQTHVHPPREKASFATALSPADNDTLALAIQLRAQCILADDRILRAMAEAQGIRPLGTLGILLTALRQGILSKGETRRLLDALVGLHDFRIGIEVYQAVIAQVDASPVT